MDQKQMLKQIVEFNQATFNSTFNAIEMLQDQFERVAQTVMDQASWMPAEGRKAVDSWIAACKAGRDNYKSYLDESYKQAEKYLNI